MKGFLSFALVLAMMVCLLWFGIALNANAFELEKTNNELIKAEEANKERTLLENGLDKIVKVKLEEQLTIKNFNVQTAQNSINSALAGYLNKKAYACNLTNQKTGEATIEFLNENSSVMILEAEGMVYAEYTFTSNVMKNSTLCAKLGDKIISYFKVPADYIQKELRPE